MTPISVALVGCVAFSRRMFDVVAAMPEVRIAAVVTRDSSPGNADFASLAQPAAERGIPVHLAAGRDDAGIAAFLGRSAFDVGLCVGWSYLLSGAVLATARVGFVGYHPAALPRNRGRHPIIWALALGLPETASTFFQLQHGADTGPVLDQRTVPIGRDDDAAALYERLCQVAETQIRSLLPGYARGEIKGVPQDDGGASSWRRRKADDGRIDWRMSFEAIDCLVRALRPPYPGATCRLATREVPVWRVAPGPEAPANIEPGKILAVSGRELLVKCWGGSVRVIEHGFEPIPQEGVYLG